MANTKKGSSKKKSEYGRWGGATGIKVISKPKAKKRGGK